tara:strand:- start:3140 stop:4447 length:1308 start_codon:yes stop_codon:yes gene_type:complete
MSRFHAAALAALLAVPAFVAPAFGQETDPEAVLRASAEALAETPGFAAQFRLVGEGSEMIKNTMPSMTGRLMFGKGEDGRVLHVLGEARDSANGPSSAFDIVRTGEKITWTDDAKRAIVTRRATPEPREMPSAARLLHLANLLDPEPYAAALARAEAVEHEGLKAVAGENCDVVLISFVKAQGANRGGPGHTAERWFISAGDRLPRKLEQITDAGMLKFSLVTEMSNLRIGEQPPEMLDVRRPEDYRVDDNTVAAEPKPQPAPPSEPEPDMTAPPAQDPAARPADPTPPVARTPRAPAFSFTPDGGSVVNNGTQNGRVTVLYFWGTWCIPCRAVSPKVSEIAARFADGAVDVFAPAIRERDAEGPRSYIADNDYKHRLVLGADALATSFKVRVYPTVIVIGPTGEIVYQAHPGPDRTADQMADQIAAAIEGALAN